MPATVRVMANRRPRRSAREPKNTPPTGRATKPTANTARLANTALAAFSVSKNWSAKNGANTA
jgi:hypothetical protein